MQIGMARLKMTQDKYDFPSNKCSFRCGSSTHLANKCNIAKRKTCQKCGKEGHFPDVCNQNLINCLLICYKMKDSPMKSTVLLSTAH